MQLIFPKFFFRVWIEELPLDQYASSPPSIKLTPLVLARIFFEMDPHRIHAYKMQAINKYKRQQFVNNLVLYTLTTLVCTLFCASPLWYPPFCATFNVFLFFSLPKISSIFLSPKVLFIIGNLIVIFLVGEWKITKPKTSSACDAYYNKHMARSGSLRKCSSRENMQDRKIEKYSSSSKKMVDVQDQGDEGSEYWREKIRVGEKVKKVELVTQEDDQGSALPAEDLNKLADDFIARVNRRRRLEAELFSRG